jgi:hypothetical protein
MDIFKDIRTQLVIRVGFHDDEASITLKGHLLSEYLMNRIIEKKIKQSQKHVKSTYSKKLKLMETEGLLAEEIIHNLQLLNTFRNRMVHELDAAVHRSEMVFFKTDGSVMQVKPKKGRYPTRFYLKLLCHGVLTQLTNHMLFQLRVDPKWDARQT